MNGDALRGPVTPSDVAVLIPPVVRRRDRCLPQRVQPVQVPDVGAGPAVARRRRRGRVAADVHKSPVLRRVRRSLTGESRPGGQL